MFSKFFIERPIFASVISIVIMLAGAACIRVLSCYTGRYRMTAPRPLKEVPCLATTGGG